MGANPEDFADDSDLRERIGKAARRKVEREYSLQVTAPRLAALLRSAVVHLH